MGKAYEKPHHRQSSSTIYMHVWPLRTRRGRGALGIKQEHQNRTPHIRQFFEQSRQDSRGASEDR